MEIACDTLWTEHNLKMLAVFPYLSCNLSGRINYYQPRPPSFFFCVKSANPNFCTCWFTPERSQVSRYHTSKRPYKLSSQLWIISGMLWIVITGYNFTSQLFFIVLRVTVSNIAIYGAWGPTRLPATSRNSRPGNATPMPCRRRAKFGCWTAPVIGYFIDFKHLMGVVLWCFMGFWRFKMFKSQAHGDWTYRMTWVDWMMVDRGLVWFTGVVSYTYLVGIRGFSGDCPFLSIEMGEWYAGTVHPSPSGRFSEAITSVNPASPVFPHGKDLTQACLAMDPWWVAPPYGDEPIEMAKVKNTDGNSMANWCRNLRWMRSNSMGFCSPVMLALV